MFGDQSKFMVFRYSDRLPRTGVRAGDVFHILWLEAKYGELYDHG